LDGFDLAGVKSPGKGLECTSSEQKGSWIVGQAGAILPS
jgi:hypothetical protein